MHPTVREFEAPRIRRDRVDFRPGDTIRVSVRIIEGEKERVQDFEGVCLNRRGAGMGETFTVRRISYGVGMERIFPVSSPRIENIRVVRRGKVRRAHLTYLKTLRGKKARITEDLLRSQKIARGAKEADAAASAAAAAEAQSAPAPAAEPTA